VCVCVCFPLFFLFFLMLCRELRDRTVGLFFVRLFSLFSLLWCRGVTTAINEISKVCIPLELALQECVPM